MAKSVARTAEPGPAEAKPGHNNPPNFALIVTEQMTVDYAHLMSSTADMLKNAQNLPKTVESPQDSEKVSLAIKELRDTSARAEAARVKEKEEYLRKGNAVDQFFKGLMDRLDKGADILHARVHAYNEKRRLAEEQRRREEFERTQREAREAAQRFAAEQQAARDAEAAAARARKSENIEAHQQVAEQHHVEAESARIDTLMAAAAADEARIATLQKPAEMVRERFDSGVLNTMAQVGYVELVDRDKLDMNKLRPYFKDAELLRAITQYAKATGHKKPMDGAIIEMRADTIIK